jgi:hypothetical protein
LTSIDLKSDAWAMADYVVSVEMQRYCRDDANITMKLMKNRNALQIDEILAESGPTQVDGEPWWRIDLNHAASQWLRSLNDPRVVEVAARLFDVPEDIYILTKLTWV